MTTEHEFGSSIPVIRMLSEEDSKEFYLEFLGYKIDWEHRFTEDDPDSPLYMQISYGDSIIHLNGHASNSSPTAEVRIPVKNLGHYELELGERCGKWPKPEAVDPRYEGRNTDMNIIDPADNYLVFWAPGDSD